MPGPSIIDQARWWDAAQLEEPFRMELPELFIADLDTCVSAVNVSAAVHMLQLATRMPHHRFLMRTNNPNVMSKIARSWDQIVNAATAREGMNAWPVPNIGFAAGSHPFADQCRFLDTVGGAVRARWFDQVDKDMSDADLSDATWVIASGQFGSVPTSPQWISGLANRAKDAGAIFTFTSWGSWEPFDGEPDGTNPKEKVIYDTGVDRLRPDIPGRWNAMRRTSDRYSRSLAGHEFDMLPRGWASLRRATLTAHETSGPDGTTITGKLQRDS